VSPTDHARAFAAIELLPALRGAIGDLQARLAPRLGGIRLVRPEGIHLTLRFLGDASPAQVESLRAPLAEAAALCPAGEARVAGLGTFPERGSPRILWLGLEVPGPVLDLQRACEQVARAAGFEKEERPFRAHLTLGRWRERAARPDLPPVDLGPTRLETLVLFRSDLRPDGAVYTPLARFALGRRRRLLSRTHCRLR
jgi:RNA 2',3'-cyclic 3'-phosphodiesterase